MKFEMPVIPPEGVDLNAAVAAFERLLIIQALISTGGNATRAAELLRVGRTTVQYRMRALKIATPRPYVRKP